MKIRKWKSWLPMVVLFLLSTPSLAQAATPSVVHTSQPGFLSLWKGFQSHWLSSAGDWMDAMSFEQTPLERVWKLYFAPEDWTIPEPREWTMVDGVPVVGTPRLDELWFDLDDSRDLYRIRKMYKLRTSTLRDLNPDVDFEDLESGFSLKVWERDPNGIPQSVGSSRRGRLVYGEPLPPGQGYTIMYPHRTFGTYYTISEITRALSAFHRTFPETAPLLVGDISFRRGRTIRPHASHQSGRDVDITYPRLDEAPNHRRFHYIRRRNLDAKKSLWLLREFISGGMVEYVFMDRWVQRKLYNEARRQGAPDEWLTAVFQYPYHSGTDAIVRHQRGHGKHFHVRFRCQPTDRRCH